MTTISPCSLWTPFSKKISLLPFSFACFNAFVNERKPGFTLIVGLELLELLEELEELELLEDLIVFMSPLL